VPRGTIVDGTRIADGVITFEWADWNLASVSGPWSATGTLKGNSLTVQYNPIMHHNDFEDAAYVLMP
jgi:hypothetical protein